MLRIDTRWHGDHGIGRFSREVVGRLVLEWSEFTSRISPSSPADAINPTRLSLSARDTIYSPGYNAGITVARQLLTLHDMIHLDVPAGSTALKRAYYERVIRPAVVRAGTVLTVSEVSRKSIEDWLGTDSVKVVNVGNGCSDAFSVEGGRSTHLRDYFIYVGNLRPHKNFEVLLRALALRPEFRLLVVARDEEGVRSAARHAEVGDRVFTTSQVRDEQLAEHYRGSLGLLFPSTLEGFGLPVIEATSCGVPVAYWAGCASVVEAVSSHSVRVDGVSDSAEWAAAMDALAELRATGLVMPDSEWSARYRWNAVAGRVETALRVAGSWD